MNIRRAALAFGIVFLLAGVVEFVASPLALAFNATHLLFGVLGILASRGARAARGYFRVVGIAFALAAVLGLIFATKIPVGFSNAVYFHGLIALGAIYFGFITPATPAHE